MIYENVLKKCGERNISVHKLEKSAGLGNATVRGWKHSNPKIDKVKLVADFFGCTIDELLREEE